MTALAATVAAASTAGWTISAIAWRELGGRS